MNVKNIILIGITGVGKTTVGKCLAKKLNKEFIDLDKYIEFVCGVDTPTIFELEGEKGFRSREYYALKDVLENKDNFVLSLGGGAIVSSENRALLANHHNMVIELFADLKIIIERVSKSPHKRPLLFHEDIALRIIKLYEERKDLYTKSSDFRINTSDLKPNQVASLLIKNYLNG